MRSGEKMRADHEKVLLVATTKLCKDGLTEIFLHCARAASGYRLGIALGEGCEPAVEQELQRMGTVYVLPSRKHRLPGYIASLRRLVKEENYDTVYIHGNSATMAFDLLAAWLGGAEKRITHVHNCARQPLLKQLTLGTVLNGLVTCPVACSEASGEMLYRKPFRVLKNGVDCGQFAFSPRLRASLRKKLGLGDAFVVGHIGRFSPQKNQKRLIHIFAGLVRIRPDAFLLFCGEGEDQKDCENEAETLGIRDRVLFLGNVEQPQNYYQVMDVFVLPSLFEGLPLVGVEAQVCGLPCVFSDTITRETAILPNCVFVPLEASDAAWADAILNCRACDRITAWEQVEQAGFTESALNGQLAELYGCKESEHAYIGGNDDL